MGQSKVVETGGSRQSIVTTTMRLKINIATTCLLKKRHMLF